VSLEPTLRFLWRCGVETFLPALHRQPGQALWFIEHRKGDPLVRNRYGILEPSVTHHIPTPAWALDLILLPLVAFDATGNRLGMGGGFYDRSLAPVYNRVHAARPRLVGIAHEGQRVAKLTPMPWDIPLDAVLTETGFHPFKKTVT
jgi:5-formyltetrahydrofolate cyclo-ligase